MNGREIYRELKRRVTSGEYKPGSVLPEKGIADELAVSRTPIRHALIRLEAEGLVRIIPNRGVYVTEMTLQRFRDLLEVRISLIRLAGRLASQRITTEELQQLSLLAKKAKSEGEPKKLQQLDLQFHDLMNRTTKNRVLIDTLEILRNQMPRIWCMAHADREHFMQIPGEIDAIVQALRSRDSEECERRLAAHINRYRQYVSDGT